MYELTHAGERRRPRGVEQRRARHSALRTAALQQRVVQSGRLRLHPVSRPVQATRRQVGPLAHTRASSKHISIMHLQLLTLGRLVPLFLQGGEAVGAERRHLLLRADLHSSRGDGARTHQDVLQERGVHEPTGGDAAHDLHHWYCRHDLPVMRSRAYSQLPLLLMAGGLINKHFMHLLKKVKTLRERDIN